MTVVLGAACGYDDPSGLSARVPGSANRPLPDWLTDVEPDPGALRVSERAVGLDHPALPPHRDVRLLIDGVDVTAHAGISANRENGVGSARTMRAGTRRLLYDPRGTAGGSLIELEPGPHSATALLVQLSDRSRSERLIDDYQWTFTIR